MKQVSIFIGIGAPKFSPLKKPAQGGLSLLRSEYGSKVGSSLAG
jgi:hypothetical protein